jgi:hypothetical protein
MLVSAHQREISQERGDPRWLLEQDSEGVSQMRMWKVKYVKNER